MFAFRLCLALGLLHPDYLLNSLTSRQLAEWMAYYAVDPFGDQRGDLQAGIIAATVSNRWRGKNEAPAKPVDFMPYIEKPQQSAEEIQRTLRSILGAVTSDG